MRVWLLASFCFAILSVCHGQSSGRAIGDQCDSGQTFPVGTDVAVFVGCSKFGGVNWCRRQDGTFEICPSFPIVPASPKSKVNTKNSPKRPVESSPGLKVVITEMMVINDKYVDEDGETTDWVEIHNGEATAINLEGWALTDDPEEPQKWMFPSLEIGPNKYIIVFASGKDRVSDVSVHTNFRMKGKGEYLALTRPDGTIASAIANEYPRQIPNVSYGIAKYPNHGTNGQFTFLNEATPGADNVGPRESGPYISSVEAKVKGDMPAAGEDLPVSAVVTEHLGPVQDVSLTYQVMYGPEKTVKMTQTGDGPIYSTVIPGADMTAGSMVRWFVTTTDAEDNVARDPILVTEDWPQYYGTVVADASIESSLPTIHWFTSDSDASISEAGFRGSVFYKGEFYDNVFTRRRGVTALTWKKPKIKFDFKGKVFKYKKGRPSVEEFNLQSFWDELGEDSYMREPVAFQVMREAGVPASDSFHVRVNQNGEFYGLFAFVEQVDDAFLERHGMSVAGPLFKATHGQLSNLRWDVQTADLQWAYKKGNRKELNEWQLLHDLTQALGGGGPVSKSSYLFDRLELPVIINYMAVNSVTLNQDRCTKNFYMYRDPSTQRWSIFPWDLESSFGLSNGLGGEPAPDYCILACEQWNSPLYCDSDHPQDLPELAALTPTTGRRLYALQAPPPPAIPTPAPATPPRVSSTQAVVNNTEYDVDRTGGPSIVGAAGTYNHLDDAILDWPVTREMYLRRLRSLIDQFHNGRLETMFRETWESIQGEAAIDNEKWGVTTAPLDNGLQQLLTEQLPTRKQQLDVEYGSSGTGLIPDSQPETPSLTIGAVTGEYIEILNSNDFAVDMSGWALSGDASFMFTPGTVVPSNGRVYLTPNIAGFLSRGASPKGGEGHFVVGPCSDIAGSSLNLVNEQGKNVL